MIYKVGSELSRQCIYLEDGEGSLDRSVVHELQLYLLHVPPDGVALAPVGLVLVIRHLHHPTLRYGTED
jgi:hypothetical protein